MKNITSKIILSVFAISLMGCTKDFLEKLPETSIGKENFFNTEEDLRLALYNLYDFSDHGIYSADSYTMTDNAWSTGNIELKTMMTSITNSNNITGGWTWDRLRNINFFLENFKKASLPEDKLNHYEGVARFFRARFYVEKIKRYSDVPWIDQSLNINSTDLLFGARDPREKVVQHILEDYEYAMTKVEEQAPTGAVHRWLVKADYARFLLYEGTYRKYHPELKLEASASKFLERALEIVTDIIAKGPFELAPDYKKLFYSADLSTNKEVIFGRYYETDVLNGDSGFGVFGNYETFPVKDLVQAYLMKDGSFYTAQSGYEKFSFVKEFENRDPRLYHTFAYPGWELIRTGTYAQGGGTYVQQLAKNFSGYHQIKGFYNTTIETEYNRIDVPLYRYAELLLIFAETKAELGVINQADLDMSINKLRNRVGMPSMVMSVAEDPVEVNRFLNVSGNQRNLILEIRRERRIELAMEGYRYDDLMRWGAGKSLEREPQGIYFDRLGKHDLTGDGIEDIVLLPLSQSIPDVKEKNSLGKTLIYYRVGVFGDDSSIFLETRESGNLQLLKDIGTFVEPKYYYRPIPNSEVMLNPNLKQIFDWN